MKSFLAISMKIKKHGKEGGEGGDDSGTCSLETSPQ